MLIFSLAKVGPNPKVTSFFEDFPVKRKTNYTWNEFSSPTFEVNVGVGQGSALSPILSALYLSPLLYILEKYLKTLNISVSLLSFVDDGLLISQNKSIDVSNSQLFCSYNVLSGLLNKFGLNIEHSKTESFHFNRSHRTFNPSPLDLTPLGGLVLCPKNLWKYLGFIFDRKLTFHQHIDFYSNKAISTVKCMKLQRRAAIWILGAFKTSPMEELEAIAGLIPIKFHLHKLVGRSQLRSASLPENHLIKNLMDDSLNTRLNSHPHSINSLTACQKTSIKGHIIDSNNKLYGVFPSFSPLNLK